MCIKNLSFVAILTLILAFGVIASPQKSLLDELKLPITPGSKVVMEANIPKGKLMESIANEYGAWLGLSDLQKVGVIVLSVDQYTPAQKLLSHYDKELALPTWRTIAKSLEGNAAMAIVYNETNGMLVMNIDPAGQKDRRITIVRVLGKLDPDKLARSERTLPDKIRQWINGPFGPDGESGIPETVARISAGRPISIPPAKWLQVKSLRSDVRAYIKPQNTFMIDAYDKSNDYGELVRTNTGLALSIAPQLKVSSMQLPSTVPCILHITEGSLKLVGTADQDNPVKLDVIATSAPVIIDSYPLKSGIHTIKSVNSSVDISLSEVTGGALEVAVMGNDMSIVLPSNASVNLEAAVTSGKIQNLTNIPPQDNSNSGFINLVSGDKKAAISLQIINGNLLIKSAD